MQNINNLDKNKELELKVELVKTLLNEIKSNYNLDIEDIIKPEIPISIFSNKLSAFQGIVKYLKENKNKSVKEISLITGRNIKTIYSTYSQANNTSYEKIKEHEIMFPIEIIKEKLSILGSIVWFLKNKKNLKLKEIAILINRDYQTVYTSYKRYLGQKNKIIEEKIKNK
jgi:phosphoribosylaminoimidazole-succinocarboxamide synthase